MVSSRIWTIGYPFQLVDGGEFLSATLGHIVTRKGVKRREEEGEKEEFSGH